MAGFCGKCGTPLDNETGLCPVCQPAVVQPDFVAENTAVAAPAQVIAAETLKEKKKKPRAVTVLITVLVSILLFVIAFSTVLLLNVKPVLSKYNVEDIISDIEISELANGAKLDEFYEYLWANHQIHVTDKSLDEFVEDSSITEYIAEEVSDFSDDLFEYGGGKIVVTEREIYEVLLDDRDLIEEHFGARLGVGEIREIADKIVKDDEMEIYSSDDLEDNYPVVFYTIEYVCSTLVLVILGILCLLLILLMVKNSLSQAACGTGVVFVIIGCIMLLPLLLKSMLATAMETVISADGVGSIVGNIIVKFVENAAVTGIIFFLLGIALFVVNKFVIKRFLKKA